MICSLRPMDQSTIMKLQHPDTEEPHASPIIGRVDAVRGTIIDVVFENRVPPLAAAMRCCDEHSDTALTAIVHSHLNGSTVRAIAIDSTRGLRRGSRVESDGLPLSVPVGEHLLGRVIDLHGTAR
jgi:F-type H+-transporting ATPase subunit beta